jgi:type IV pilus assembly protein PilA
VAPPSDDREAAAQSDLRNAAAAATACAAANDGSYVECGTEAQLLSYGFDKSPDVTYVNLTATASRWVSATQHNDGGSAYQFDTSTGEIQPVPRF